MKHETIEDSKFKNEQCSYGVSRMLFRGPKRQLTSPYVAFLGGTETYGKFIDRPFPALLERPLGCTCVNFGCVNGGVDAFVNDPTIMGICSKADLTVVQVMGANYLSNRFYSVHPRRNDRFLRASTVLKAIYHDVDFSEFTFTRHMLSALYEKSPERFDIVVAELREAWIARMRNMLHQVGPQTVLLWFSEEALSDQPWSERRNQLQTDPLFISASMIDQLRPMVREVAVVRPSRGAIAHGPTGMLFAPSEKKAASEMLGVMCHKEASVALMPVLRRHIAVDA